MPEDLRFGFSHENVLSSDNALLLRVSDCTIEPDIYVYVYIYIHLESQYTIVFVGSISSRPCNDDLKLRQLL